MLQFGFLAGEERELVSFATHPSKYQHWSLAVEGDVARLKLDINEEGGIDPELPVIVGGEGVPEGLRTRPAPRYVPSADLAVRAIEDALGISA